jgi:hypothetical protein
VLATVPCTKLTGICDARAGARPSASSARMESLPPRVDSCLQCLKCLRGSQSLPAPVFSIL